MGRWCRYSRSIDKLSGDDAGTIARFQAWLRGADRAVSTVRSYATVAGEFVAFTGGRDGLARCGAGTIDAFVATLAGYQAKTVEQKLCALRSFLVFACAEGLLDAAVADAVPAARSTKQLLASPQASPGQPEVASASLPSGVATNRRRGHPVQPDGDRGHPLPLPGSADPHAVDPSGDSRRVDLRHGLVESRTRGNSHVRFGSAGRGNGPVERPAPRPGPILTVRSDELRTPSRRFTTLASPSRNYHWVFEHYRPKWGQIR